MKRKPPFYYKKIVSSLLPKTESSVTNGKLIISTIIVIGMSIALLNLEFKQEHQLNHQPHNKVVKDTIIIKPNKVTPKG